MDTELDWKRLAHLMKIVHIAAFSKGLTPFPRWCWLFCPAVGMALAHSLFVWQNQV